MREQNGRDGGSDRTADALEHVELGCGVGDLLSPQFEEEDGSDSEDECADEQGDSGTPVIGERRGEQWACRSQSVHDEAAESQDSNDEPDDGFCIHELLIPLPAQHLNITIPTDPRGRAVAERLIAHPDDQRELAAWADGVHTSVCTLARLLPCVAGTSRRRRPAGIGP